jgi:hypothetical protein
MIKPACSVNLRQRTGGVVAMPTATVPSEDREVHDTRQRRASTAGVPLKIHTPAAYR